ncbi:MAG: multifunctional CCA tRNA nucleotidyl transferase/2'3'-cyclic phosphodiesterase/2'nucleotidase/phosphatase, partial [Gammaproteobacteria bacterium]
QFLLACEADARGRPGYEERDFDQPKILRAAHAAAMNIDASAAAAEAKAAGLTGPAIGEAVKRKRLDAIKASRRGE